MHVRLIHVVLLDLLQHFAVHHQRLIGLVVRGASQHLAESHPGDYQHRSGNDRVACETIHPAPPYLEVRILSIPFRCDGSHGSWIACLSSIILSPLNSNVKMSPHETGDIHVESEGTAASERDQRMYQGRHGVCQSRRTPMFERAPD